MKRDPTLKIGCSLWERGSRVGMTGVFYRRDARLSISSSPMIVWARNLFSCILQTTSSKLLWYQAIFIVGIIHSQLPSSKFNMPILCALNHCACRPPSLRCQYFALNHCACRPPSLRGQYFPLNLCACRPPSPRGQYFALNHCACRPPSFRGQYFAMVSHKNLLSNNITKFASSTALHQSHSCRKCDHVFGKKMCFGCLWFVNMDRGS